ncbi:MAG: hypothetical protein H0X30_22690 [Anaerolineae bacterium]|nr:hypothetical protein [Anaerolineae bacterium]
MSNGNVYQDQIEALNTKLEGLGQELAALVRGDATPGNLTTGERIADLLDGIQQARPAKTPLQRKAALIETYKQGLVFEREGIENNKQMQDLQRRVNSFQKEVQRAAVELANRGRQGFTIQQNALSALTHEGATQDELNAAIEKAHQSVTEAEKV